MSHKPGPGALCPNQPPSLFQKPQPLLPRNSPPGCQPGSWERPTPRAACCRAVGTGVRPRGPSWMPHPGAAGAGVVGGAGPAGSWPCGGQGPGPWTEGDGAWPREGASQRGPARPCLGPHAGPQFWHRCAPQRPPSGLVWSPDPSRERGQRGGPLCLEAADFLSALSNVALTLEPHCSACASGQQCPSRT